MGKIAFFTLKGKIVLFAPLISLYAMSGFFECKISALKSKFLSVYHQ